MRIIRTTSSNTDFHSLCDALDKELDNRYGKSQPNYDKPDVIEDNKNVLVGYFDSKAVACVCMKPIDKKTIEVTRMFVKKSYRRKGLSSSLLSSLEKWASEFGFSISILGTGKAQPEAINLYKKLGYIETEKFGQYVTLRDSLCMRKTI